MNTLPYPWSPQSSICRILRILLVFYTWTSSWKCMEGQKSIHVHIKSPFSGTSTKRCRWSLNHSTIPIGWLVGSTGGTQWWLDSMDSLCANLWPSIKAWRGAPRETTVGPSSRENERNGMLTLKRDPSLKGHESSSKHQCSGENIVSLQGGYIL